MHLFIPGVQAPNSLVEERDRLQGLLDDVARILRGEGPMPEAASEVPVLDRWAVARTAEPCLIGLATGHPRLPGTERPIATSRLWLMSADGTWARTLSRWYRLGRPASQAGRPS